MMKLIENWKKFYLFWSVQLTAVGTSILAGFFAFPDAFMQVWSYLPHEIKELIPPEYGKWIPIILICTGVFSRVLKQDFKNDTKCKKH